MLVLWLCVTKMGTDWKPFCPEHVQCEFNALPIAFPPVRFPPSLQSSPTCPWARRNTSCLFPHSPPTTYELSSIEHSWFCILIISLSLISRDRLEVLNQLLATLSLLTPSSNSSAWRHFWWPGWSSCYWHPVGRGQGGCRTFPHNGDSPTENWYLVLSVHVLLCETLCWILKLSSRQRKCLVSIYCLRLAHRFFNKDLLIF